MAMSVLERKLARKNWKLRSSLRNIEKCKENYSKWNILKVKLKFMEIKQKNLKKSVIFNKNKNVKCKSVEVKKSGN